MRENVSHHGTAIGKALQGQIEIGLSLSLHKLRTNAAYSPKLPGRIVATQANQACINLYLIKVECFRVRP